MNESQRLARQLDLALHGEAWHGPSWQEILTDVTAATAAMRPVPSAHSIFELLGHVSTWNEVVRLRLEGHSPNVTDQENFPETERLDETSWNAAVARFVDQGSALREAIAAFPPERLHETRPNLDGTWQDLILGQLQHVLYHAGQAALVKKAT